MSQIFLQVTLSLSRALVPTVSFLLAQNHTFTFDAKLNLLGDLGELQKVLD